MLTALNEMKPLLSSVVLLAVLLSSATVLTASEANAEGQEVQNDPGPEHHAADERVEDSAVDDGRLQGLQAGQKEEGVFKLSDKSELQHLDELQTVNGRAIEPEEFGATFDTIVKPYEETCYFQPAKKGSSLHVQFHVEGNAKFNDIDLEVRDPAGQLVLKELQSRGNTAGEHDETHNDDDHEDSNIKVHVTGDYQICFSNARTKTPNYEKRLHLDIGPVIAVKYSVSLKDELPEEQSERMMESLEMCVGGLDTIMDMQQSQRRWHRSDLTLSEDSNELVVLRSIVIIIAMCMSVGLQTYFIRTLFNSGTAGKA